MDQPVRNLKLHCDDLCVRDSRPAFAFDEDSSNTQLIPSRRRTTDDLGTALSAVGHEIAVDPQVRFRIVLEGQSQALQPVAFEYLYRIGREALLNAFRHSEGNRVDLRLEYTPAKLRMTIRDNGRGMSADSVCAGSSGLTWMKGLAERIGANLRLLSRARAGTEVLLSIPGDIAFAAEKSVGPQLAVA